MYADPQETAEENATRLDGPAVGAAAKARFQGRFAAELRRLAGLGRELDAWEEENMLSALGAAALAEYELAIAFVDAIAHPPSPPPTRDFRRLPMSVANLNRRFERTRAAN
jgi:hypothetical protein